MVRMAKKVKVKKERRPVTQPAVEAAPEAAAPEAPVSEKKPRRQRPAEKPPVTKAEFTVKAGKVQAKLNAITANQEKAHATATNRVNAKYRGMVKEELEGLHEGVVALLVLPDFAVDDVLSDLVEGEEFVEITTDDTAEEAAE